MKNYNEKNEWVWISAMTPDYEWVIAKLPPTNFTIVYPNGHRLYVYRNRSLPPDNVWTVEYEGGWLFIGTDFMNPFEPKSAPYFPIPLNQMIHWEDAEKTSEPI